MTETFKVGDKVQHDDKTATVAGGPHMGYSAWYVVEDADGKEYPVGADRLTLAPTDPRREVVARALSDWDRNIRPDEACHGADAILAALDAMETPHPHYMTGSPDSAESSCLHCGNSGSEVDEPRPLAVGDMVRITRELRPEHSTDGPNTGKVGPIIAIHSEEDYPYDVDVSGYGQCAVHSVERITGDTETIDGVTYDLNARYRDEDDDAWERQDDGSWRHVEYASGEPVSRPISARVTDLWTLIGKYGPLTRI
ncbi:phiSA1p31-related protein [Streptomyces sp. NPDC001520]|uniref:phiSA1p31-related protein n=1 Tax=Streptomyces sp. NPDC001520 TaxID=3364581 RepID=UPI00368BEAE3